MEFKTVLYICSIQRLFNESPFGSFLVTCFARQARLFILTVNENFTVLEKSYIVTWECGVAQSEPSQK